MKKFAIYIRNISIEAGPSGCPVAIIGADEAAVRPDGSLEFKVARPFSFAQTVAAFKPDEWKFFYEIMPASEITWNNL